MLWSMNGNHGFKPYFQCFDPALVIDHTNTGLFSTWFTNHIDVGVRYVCGNFPKTKSLNVFLIVLSNWNCFIAFRRLRHWQRQKQGVPLKRSYFPKSAFIQIQHFCFQLWENFTRPVIQKSDMLEKFPTNLIQRKILKLQVLFRHFGVVIVLQNENAHFNKNMLNHWLPSFDFIFKMGSVQ